MQILKTNEGTRGEFNVKLGLKVLLFKGLSQPQFFKMYWWLNTFLLVLVFMVEIYQIYV